jgi:glycosyltransferase involved in cell wall biosynthesis
VPTLNLSGGLRVVAIYAKLLAEKGHQVSVASPNRTQASLKARLKSLLKGRGFTLDDAFDATFFNSPLVNMVMLPTSRPVEAKDVPDGDIVIATFWNTAEWVADFPDNKGKKVYFVQHYEVHPWLPVDRVKATLQHPFKKIAVSQWIADILAKDYDDNAVAVVPNGVDTEQFNAPPRTKQAAPTVGVMYSTKTFKGFDTALEALKIAKKSIPELGIIMFGSEQPLQTNDFPKDTQFHLKPDQEALKGLYGGCDAWLFSSRFEGFGLPILEAMACRTPVIGTKAGAAPDLINQANGMLVEIDDAPGMANAIVAIAAMPIRQWSVLSQNAYDTALQHTWAASVTRFENVLLDLC